VMKSNYGPSGETIQLRWERGRFVLARCNSKSAITNAEKPFSGCGALLLFPLELLQRLRAADAHFLLIGFETFQNPAASGFDAFAKPLHVAHAIGFDVRHFLCIGGRREQA